MSHCGQVAVAAGGSHSVLVASDGSAVALGLDWDGQCAVPAGEAKCAIAQPGSSSPGFGLLLLSSLLPSFPSFPPHLLSVDSVASGPNRF